MPDSEYRDEFRDRVLNEFRQLRTDILEVNAKLDAVRNMDITSIKVEIAVLKTKAALIGALSGLVVSSIVALLTRLLAR